MDYFKALDKERTFSKNKAKLRFPFIYFGILISILFCLAIINFKDPSSAIRLGLDLRGGTTIVLQPQQIEKGKINPETLSQALEILRQRVDGIGVSESEIRSEGSGDSTKIIVSVPGSTENDLVNLVGQSAKLSIRPVLYAGSSFDTKVWKLPDNVSKMMFESYLNLECQEDTTSYRDDISTFLIACDKAGSTKYILGSTKVDGSQIIDAQFAYNQGAFGWTTNLSFDSNGKSNFGNLSTQISSLASPQNQIAIVLDGKVVVAPRVDGPLTGGQVRIYGNFSQEYAKNLANILRYGALPFSFRVDEVEKISSTLGSRQLKSGVAAGILGLLLISIYLMLSYRALGLIAIASLALAFALTYLLFAVLGNWIGLTLTLAGIAGAIVSIGVTTDSFIVFFERVRDEMRLGTTLRVALENGWQRAKRTIWIADIVSLLAALILYLFTTGNVRGFAFTLGITTLIDLVIVYFFTRPFLTTLAGNRFFALGHRLSGLSQASLGIINEIKSKRKLNLSALGGRLFRGESSINIVEGPKRWFGFSGFLIISSIISLSYFGLNLGIEFKGGNVNIISEANPSPETARSVLDEIGYKDQAVIQVIGSNKLRIETSQLKSEDADQLTKSLAKAFNVDVTTIDSLNIGPSWGTEITRKALLGLFWFIVALIIYLSFAFEIRMAMAAMFAVIHDVLITVGIYSATGLKITPAAVIGFLTILGYSLYDTVVVFDKIRENVKKIKKKDTPEYLKAVNLALNQTLIRSINTSVVAIIPIASIFVVGAIFLQAETLKDISLALLIGQSIGTYSSIFIAAPLLVKFHKGKKANNGVNKRDTDFIDYLGSPSIKIKAQQLDHNNKIDLINWEITALGKADAPDLFRTFYGNNEVWENIFVDKPIPVSLEQCISEVSKINSKNSHALNYYAIRKKGNQLISGIISLIFDQVNLCNRIGIEALNFQDKTEIVNFFNELSEYSFQRHMRRIEIHCMDLSSQKRILGYLPLIEEGRLHEARRTRSGWIDILIFRLIGD